MLKQFFAREGQQQDAARRWLPKVVIGCAGVFAGLLLLSVLLSMIANTVDPEGFANVQAGKHRDGSERESAEPTEQLDAADWDELVAASVLYKQFDGNQVAADEKYKGKTIFVEGEVVNVEKAGFGNTSLNLACRRGVVGVRCYLSSSAARSDELKTVRPGTWVKVRGYCKGLGLGGSVLLSDSDFLIVNR